jgi:hypothetical protein
MGHRKKFANPGVLGGVLYLGRCLDLNTRAGCDEVADAYDLLKAHITQSGETMPQNSYGPDRLKRDLDCQVIMYLHRLRKDAGLDQYPCTRGPDFGRKTTSRSASGTLKNAFEVISSRSKTNAAALLKKRSAASFIGLFV